MILNAFSLLQNQLGDFIESANGDKLEIVIDNVSQIDAPSSAERDLKEKLIMTLVNIEEEATLKNGNNYYVRNNPTLRYKNAPVFLNLYVLISAHYNDYGTSLKRLSNVIEFFQQKRTFSIKDSPLVDLARTPDMQDVYEELLIYMDLFSLSFEQLNHLWGSLGGKQFPFVLYKMRLVKIEENKELSFGSLVETIIAKDKILTGG